MRSILSFFGFLLICCLFFFKFEECHKLNIMKTKLIIYSESTSSDRHQRRKQYQSVGKRQSSGNILAFHLVVQDISPIQALYFLSRQFEPLYQPQQHIVRGKINWVTTSKTTVKKPFSQKKSTVNQLNFLVNHFSISVIKYY